MFLLIMVLYEGGQFDKSAIFKKMYCYFVSIHLKFSPNITNYKTFKRLNLGGRNLGPCVGVI